MSGIEYTHVTAMDMKMQAKIKKTDDGSIFGELNCKFFEEPFTFTNLMSMVEMMETTFDTKGFPERQFLPRAFGNANRRLRKNEIDLPAFVKEQNINKEGTVTPVQQDADGKVCTFEILVKFRNNAEWQGTVRWLEIDTVKRFSSIVELVKNIDNALSV